MSTRYIVFDCTRGFGHAAVCRSRLGARLVATWLSIRTGRFHDYTPDYKPFARLRLLRREG